MAGLYPEIEPNESGLLDVGDGQQVYWEECGNPLGKPTVVLHGGPGSGCTPWHRRLFDPSMYRVVLFDQRNCGRSLPHASEPGTDLSSNTTQNLVGDIERLRRHLGIEQWLLLGGSWGSTLALAYAEGYPERVTELVLFGVTTGRHSEVDWTFRGGNSHLFPRQWQRLLDTLPPHERHDVIEAFHRRLNARDADERLQAAYDWCLWESATPDWPPRDELAERFRDPRYAMAFARIVNHYVKHDLFLEDDVLLRNAGCLAGIPGVLINGRHDVLGLESAAPALMEVWRAVEHIIVEAAAHSAQHAGITSELIGTLDRLAIEPD